MGNIKDEQDELHEVRGLGQIMQDMWPRGKTQFLLEMRGKL